MYMYAHIYIEVYLWGWGGVGEEKGNGRWQTRVTYFPYHHHHTHTSVWACVWGGNCFYFLFGGSCVLHCSTCGGALLLLSPLKSFCWVARALISPMLIFFGPFSEGRGDVAGTCVRVPTVLHLPPFSPHFGSPSPAPPSGSSRAPLPFFLLTIACFGLLPRVPLLSAPTDDSALCVSASLGGHHWPLPTHLSASLLGSILIHVSLSFPVRVCVPPDLRARRVQRSRRYASAKAFPCGCMYG